MRNLINVECLPASLCDLMFAAGIYGQIFVSGVVGGMCEQLGTRLYVLDVSRKFSC